MATLVLVAALALEPADRSIRTPPLEPAPLGAELRPRAAGTPETLYINFDGAVLQTGCGNDAHWDCSTLADLFDGYVGPFDGNETQRISILQATRQDVAEFGVRVVIDRPPEGEPYTMVLYGDIGDHDFAGIAPYIDCEDLHPSDLSFTAGFGGSNTGSTVVLQEAAHTWGLEHVDSEIDILNPFKTQFNQEFLDECFPVVANTDLQTTSGSCNVVHQQFCEIGFQNSWREMNWLFGPPVPDVGAPQVTIESPIDGNSYVRPVTIALRGDIDDELDPQFYGIDILDAASGQSVLGPDAEVVDVKLDLVLQNPPQGEYDWIVVVTDEAGNSGQARVAFTILPEGSELPPQDDEMIEGTASDDGGSCAIGGARSPGRVVALVAIAVAGVRRRRRA